MSEHKWPLDARHPGWRVARGLAPKRKPAPRRVSPLPAVIPVLGTPKRKPWWQRLAAQLRRLGGKTR